MSHTNKRYWKGIEEFQNTTEFVKNASSEFTPPAKEGAEDDIFSTKRRDFLKLMGFGMAAVSLAACETPVKKAIPYIVKPDDIWPSVANYYASTFYQNGDYASVLVKTREGRPIKIEGNRLSMINKGGTSAKAQASVLDLYDASRYVSFTNKPAENNKADNKAIDEAIMKGLSSARNIRIVSSTIISPSTLAVIDDFNSSYGNSELVMYDANSASGMLDANEANFGIRAIPDYKFHKAKVVVSLDADFLGSWLSSTEYNNQWAKTRRPTEENPEMSQLFVFEPLMSLTGANADVRKSIRHSEVALYASELLKLVGGQKLAAKSKKSSELEEAAKMLKANRGNSIVVCGSNDPNVQRVVNAINNELGNYGKTISWRNPVHLKKGDDKKMNAFVEDLKAGRIDAVIFYNCNPVYDHPRGKEIAASLSKVKTKVSLADRPDETALLCDFVAPDRHYLESWNDAMPKQGMYSLVQPTIKNIFDSRQAQDSFLTWAKLNTTYYDYLKAYWEKNLYPKQKDYSSFREFWNYALHDGIYDEGRKVRDRKQMAMGPMPKTNEEMASGGEELASKDSVAMNGSTEATMEEAVTKNTVEPLLVSDESIEEMVIPSGGNYTYNESNLSSIGTTIAQRYRSDESGVDLVLYEKTGIGTGSQTGNPWLLELPDPVTKATWGNYITVSMQFANKNGYKDNQVAKLTVGDYSVELPILIQPGQAMDTVGLAVGFGREFISRPDLTYGVNAFPFAKVSKDGYLTLKNENAKIELTGEEFEVARTQTHHTVMSRPIVQEATLAEYKENPAAGRYFPHVVSEDGVVRPGEVSLWDEHVFPNHHWGLTIDLNTCTGCSACVVACNAENNIPVVGRQEVLNRREMHWIRIDRYYSSDAGTGEYFDGDMKAMEQASDNPEVTFMPMMCQHCNHAPCETVCPVLATTHSTEGLNQMTYNRCIGTRYCANNCPFKVRRFNWFQYPQNDKFDYHMNNDLGRMVLNPDVTVRARGVMEKCSMCQQRIQEGKLKAKRDKRKLKDGEIVVACAEACPTDAIVFGDMNDPESRITKHLKREKDKRAYYLLEEINVQSNVAYLTKIRNKSDNMASEKTVG